MERVASSGASGQGSNIIDIQHLNDDCLIQIFECLPLIDRMKVEMVCSRWNNLAKRSWSKTNHLKISGLDNNKRINFYSSLLRRCGCYINSFLLISTSYNFDLINLKKIILKNCTSITKICLVNRDDEDDEDGFFEDKDLKLLFNKNKNIRAFSLKNFSIKGKFLENLSFLEQLEDFEIISCYFESKKSFFKALSKMKNLKKFSIKNYLYDEIELTFDALNKSNCNSIEEFCFLPYDSRALNTFDKDFFTKQTKLRKVIINNIDSLEGVTKCFSRDVEEIGIFELHSRHYGELLTSLHKFSKLHTVLFYTNAMDYKNLKIISNVMDIKHVSTHNDFCCLSTKANVRNLDEYSNYIKYLPEYTMDFSDGSTFIKNVTKVLKNIQYLNVSDTCSAEVDVTKLKNLKVLNVNYDKNCTDHWLSKIIKKVEKLEKLYIQDLEQITNNFILNANKIKKNREDSHILTIFCNGTGIKISSKEIKDLELILLNFNRQRYACNDVN